MVSTLFAAGCRSPSAHVASTPPLAEAAGAMQPRASLGCAAPRPGAGATGQSGCAIHESAPDTSHSRRALGDGVSWADGDATAVPVPTAVDRPMLPVRSSG